MERFKKDDLMEMMKMMKMANEQKPQMVALKDGQFHLAKLAVDLCYLGFDLQRQLQLAAEPIELQPRHIGAFPLTPRQFVDEDFDFYAASAAAKAYESKLTKFFTPLNHTVEMLGNEEKAVLDLSPLALRRMQISSTLRSIVEEAEDTAATVGAPYFLVHVLRVNEATPVRLGAALELLIGIRYQNKNAQDFPVTQLKKPQPPAFSLQPTVNLYAAGA